MKTGSNLPPPFGNLRIHTAWAMLRNETDYDPDFAIR